MRFLDQKDYFQEPENPLSCGLDKALGDGNCIARIKDRIFKMH